MPSRADPDPEVAAWAASGAMALTGRPGSEPLGPPAGLVPKLTALADDLAKRSEALGARLVVDPLALLGERAAIAGLGRRGPTSCGGATQLLPCGDGWLAITLARPDDVALVPAWLELPGPPSDPWAAIRAAVAGREADELVTRARWLGLPAAVLAPDEVGAPPVVRAAIGSPRPPAAQLAGLIVVELGSLWATPLCGSLLAAAGASVLKVEATDRPDGARRGPVAFFDLLNAGKRSVALALATDAGRAALAALLARADVVLEGSRPRALEQLGIDAEAVVAAGGPRVWVSITGHGRTGPGRDWVAFGDDAAVAGGLVAWDAEGPVFCADAVADPAAGLVAASATLEALAVGGRWLLDVAMARVAAHLAGPTLPVAREVEAAPPRARIAMGPGPRLGEHTDAVLAELGIATR